MLIHGWGPYMSGRIRVSYYYICRCWIETAFGADVDDEDQVEKGYSKRKENDRYLPIWCVCVLVRSIASKLYFANSSHYVFHNSVAARRAKIGGRTNGRFFGCALLPEEKKTENKFNKFLGMFCVFYECVFTGPPTYRNNVWRAVSYSAWIIFWTNRDAKAVVCRLLGEHNTIQFAEIRCETAENDNNNKYV